MSIITRGFAGIGLWQPKDSHNIGSVLRAAGCFGAQFVGVEGRRYRNAPTDTQKAWKHIPLIEVDNLQLLIPHGASCVAVDLVDEATSLAGFVHPERAFYVFGGEDRTLPETVMQWCSSRVFVPTRHCLNLAAAVNIVLYDRMAKRGGIGDNQPL